MVVNKSATLAEDAAIGTAVTKVTFTDPDVGETYSFSISAGNIGSAFAINSSGNITTATALNHEAVPSYLLTVNVMDSSGNIGTATVNITVTDVDESASTGLIAWEDAVHNATPYLKKRAQSLAGNTVASIDMSGMTAGNATYEFIVEGKNTAQLASVLLASTTWGLNLEAWRDTNRLGMVRYTVSDYAATAVAGKSVVTPYGRPVHVIFAVDSAANMTRIYLDGVHVGNVNQLPLINSATASLGDVNLRDDSNTGIHAFAAYKSLLPHQEIITHYRAWFGANSPVDSDSDSLDDSWELTHFGNLATVGANDDFSGNGYTAFEEMVFGMDPKGNSPAKAPQQLQIVDDAGVKKIEVRFRRPRNYAPLHVTYQLQTSSDLTAANWENHTARPTSTIVEGDNEWLVFKLPLNEAADPHQFYRCKVAPQ